MAGRVFVTGGSGFVGSAVIEELVSRGYGVNTLVHRRPLTAGASGARTIQGDIFDDKAVDSGIAGCSAVIHLIGIIMEKPSRGVTFERMHHQATRRVVDAALRNGVRRYVHMSALGTRPDAVSTYHRTKYAAEQYIRASGLDWTIFRPSMIHGPRGEFMQMEANWARYKSPPFLFMPYFGGGLLGTRGAGMLQPVFVGDVARAFVDALENPKTIGEIYPLAGPDRVSWPQLHRMVAQALTGRQRMVLPIPAWKAKALTYLVPRALLPFNWDQVVMSQEDNTCELSKFVDGFGWSPQSFEPTLRSYASQV